MNDRTELLKRWKQITQTNQDISNEDLQCPLDLFSRIQDLLFIELKVDQFPRFIHSEMFKKFLLKELKRDDHVLDKLGTKWKTSGGAGAGGLSGGAIGGAGGLSGFPTTTTTSSSSSSLIATAAPAMKKRTSSSEDVAAASCSSSNSLSALDWQVSTKASSSRKASLSESSSGTTFSSSLSIHSSHHPLQQHEEEMDSHDSSSTTEEEDHSVDDRIANFYESHSSDHLSTDFSYTTSSFSAMNASHSGSSSSSSFHANTILPILDETNTCITEKDYELALQLHHSYYSDTHNNSSWKVVDEKIGMKTAISPRIYTFNYSKYQHSTSSSKHSLKEISNNLRFYVAQSGIVPGTTREWIDLLYGEHVQKFYNEMYKTRFQVDYYSMNPEKDIPYPTSFMYAEAALPFPFTNRDFIYAKTIIPEQYDLLTGLYDRYVLIMKPSSHHEYPAKTNPIRASHQIIYVVEKYTRASVRYTVFETGDMAGKIPNSFSAKFFKGTAKMMHRKIRKVCEKAYESAQSTAPVRDHDGGLATLKEYEQYLAKKRTEKNTESY